MPEAATVGDRAEAARNEIAVSSNTESSGAALKAWRTKQGPEGRKAARAASEAAEIRRLAICSATRAAVAAGAFEIPPRAGSLGTRRHLEDLLSETAEGR